MDESCLSIYSCGLQLGVQSGVTNETCHAHDLIASHMWKSHVSAYTLAGHGRDDFERSDQRHEQDVSHTRISRVTHMNEPCLSHVSELARVHLWLILMWLILMCDTTYSCV